MIIKFCSYSSEKIDVRCNEKSIIIYYILIIILDEDIVFNHIIVLDIQDEAKQMILLRQTWTVVA